MSIPVVTIGANFAGSTVGLSGFIPPDSDGAAGAGDFVEMVNGVWRVYDQTSTDQMGTVLQQLSLDQFWAAAGTPPQTFAGDPRVLYDPASQHWFAAALDFNGPDSHYLLAVSDGADPTQGWHAFEFGQTFDFTELGLTGDAVTLVTNGGNADTEVVVVPKADLLAPTPTVADASFLRASFIDTGPSPQPAVAPDLSGVEVLLGVTPDALRLTSVDTTGAPPSLQIGAPISIPTGNQNTPGAVQEGTDLRIPTGNLGFLSSVVEQQGKLFGVETIGLDADQSHAALRWFEIGDLSSTPTVLDSGIISPPGLEAYYGSIAVNPLGEVVIGFSASGPNDFPSAYAVAGQLSGDTLTFGDPMLLHAGVAPETSGRFGDYSTTTYDPGDPTHFWTIQEWGAAAGWSTQISEIVFNAPPPPTTQTWFGGTGSFSNAQDWLPAGDPTATDTLIIDAGHVRAGGLVIGNPDIELGSAVTTPVLKLQDSTLAAGDTIHVEANDDARINVSGTVTEQGAIAVGAGATLEVKGAGHGAQFVNDGTVDTAGGTVHMDVAVTGQGAFDVNGGTLAFGKDVGAGEVVTFTAGLLTLDQPMGFHATIDGFNAADTIELAHTRVTAADFSGGVLTLFDKNHVAAELHINGAFTTDQFAITNSHGDAFVTVTEPQHGWLV